MSKLNSDEHINIEINQEELDEVEFSKKATYEEIKDYVLEKDGFKVTNLYIAQVKRKHGLIERVNHNLSKKASDEQVIPQCPLEKEEAIEEALEWFGMI